MTITSLKTHKEDLTKELLKISKKSQKILELVKDALFKADAVILKAQ